MYKRIKCKEQMKKGNIIEHMEEYKMSKRVLSCLLSILLIISMLLSACTSGAKEQTTSGGNTDKVTADSENSEAASAKRTDLRFALDQEPATLDPNFMGDGAGFMVAVNIYAGLVYITDDFQIQPDLAKEWEISADRLEYTFHLRDDVTFHNGEHFTAADVKYSYERAMESPYAGMVTSNMKSMEAVDDYTIKITLNVPNAAALDCFGSTFLRIVNQKAVEEAGEKFGYNPLGAGTGPFKFVSWTTGESIVLTANEDYYKGAPSIKDVTFKIITDYNTATIAVETGEVDIARIGYANLESVQDNKDLVIESVASMVYDYIGFNTTKAPFDNPKVRQAIAYSVDKNELLQVAINGETGGVNAVIPMPKGGFGYNYDIELYPKNIEKAKQLLLEAGYAEGFTCTIYTPESNERKNSAQYIQYCLAEIGITAQIEVMQQAALLELIKKGGTEIFLMGYNAASADADWYLFNNYRTGQTYNYTQYSNPKLDAMLDQAREEGDNDKRLALYQEITVLLHEELPDIPSFFRNWICAHNKDLEYKVSPFVRNVLYDIHWKN